MNTKLTELLTTVSAALESATPAERIDFLEDIDDVVDPYCCLCGEIRSM